MPKTIEIKLEKLASPKCVQWRTEDGEHRTGTLFTDQNGHAVEIAGTGMLLVKRYHTNDLYLVDTNSAEPYPAFPIPEPTK